MRSSISGKLATGVVATLAGLALHWSGFDTAARAADMGSTPSGVANSKADNGAPTEKKLSRYPIRGKIKAVDLEAQTFTLGGTKDRVFKVTPQTETVKDGRPATLADARVGDEVGGLAQQQSDGSVVALKVRFGPKTEDEQSGSKTPKRAPRSKNPNTAEVN